jgi:hypothetical protein
LKLFIVTSEKNTRYVFAGNAVDARRLAIDSGIAGHKIDRHVWRTPDGKIFESDHKPGVISEGDVLSVLNAAGYNLDGSPYEKPVPGKKTRQRGAQDVSEGFRTCRRCGETKPLEEFPPRSGGGYQSYCRPCKIMYDRENRLKKKMKSGGK